MLRKVKSWDGKKIIDSEIIKSTLISSEATEIFLTIKGNAQVAVEGWNEIFKEEHKLNTGEIIYIQKSVFTANKSKERYVEISITEESDDYVKALKDYLTPVERRVLHGMSQSELAKKTGISIATIQRYEQGLASIKKLSADKACRIADALETTVEELIL